jgi:hypothetical protein
MRQDAARAWCRVLGNYSPTPQAVRNIGQLAAIFTARHGFPPSDPLIALLEPRRLGAPPKPRLAFLNRIMD